jgi:hypothetical protein
MNVSNPMKIAPWLATLLFAASALGQSAGTDVSELLSMHAAVIQAHIDHDVDSWLALETDTTTSVNSGLVTRVGRMDRRKARIGYLERATFDSYRDVKPPIVQISDDGSIGWLIAEVEVVGWMANMDGTIEDFSNVWAWVELYERTPQGWKQTGNVSNSRPLK